MQGWAGVFLSLLFIESACFLPHLFIIFAASFLVLVFFSLFFQLATCTAIKLEDYHFGHRIDAFGRYLVLSNTFSILRVRHLLPGAGLCR